MAIATTMSARSRLPSSSARSRLRRDSRRRLVLLTVKATESVYEARYDPGDVLMMGRESVGVPAEVASGADLRVRIPMLPERRSLNVAIAASLVLGEALRQTGHFGTLQ